MKKDYPELLEQVSAHNKFDLDRFLHCGIPFIKLDLSVPEIDKQLFDKLTQEAKDWRSKWKMVETNYQVRGWNGDILFGPQDWDKWLSIINHQEFSYDEDGMASLYRDKTHFDWNVDQNNIIRQWVESFLPNVDDINLVNTYVLPPKGYLFPHVDNNPKPHLNKIYVALNWPEGNEFGFYGFGNMPIKGKSAWLINNYQYSHWVVNRSDQHRLILAISANLNSLENLIYKSWLKSFEL